MNKHAGLTQLVNKNRRFTLVVHPDPDGDCLGSAAALGMYLLGEGKQAVVYSPDGVEDPRFTDLFDGLQLTTIPPKNPGAVIVVDVGSPEKLLGYRPRDIDLLIDHHHSNELATTAKATVYDPQAAATALILARLIPANKITPQIAEALYTGIHQDTGGFQNSSTSPEVFEAIGRLVRLGGLDVQKLNYRLDSLDKKLLPGITAALKTVESSNGIVRAVIPPGPDAYDIGTETGRILGRLKNTQLVIIMTPKNGNTRAFMLSPGGLVNVRRLMQRLNDDTGHDGAGSYTHPGGPDKCYLHILATLAGE